jgi:hypothetical protein
MTVSMILYVQSPSIMRRRKEQITKASLGRGDGQASLYSWAFGVYQQ